MSDPEEELLGYLLGALDDAEHAAVEQRLKVDPQLRGHLARACCRLQPLYNGEDDIDPPPGLAQRTCRLVADYARRIAATAPRAVSRGGFGLRAWSLKAQAVPRAALRWSRLPYWMAAAGLLLAVGIILTPAAVRAPLPLETHARGAVNVATGGSSPVHLGDLEKSKLALATRVPAADRPDEQPLSPQDGNVLQGARVVLVSGASSHPQGSDFSGPVH